MMDLKKIGLGLLVVVMLLTTVYSATAAVVIRQRDSTQYSFDQECLEVNGQIICVCGQYDADSGTSNNVTTYDVSSGMFSQLGSLSTPFSRPLSCSMMYDNSSGFVYVVGQGGPGGNTMLPVRFFPNGSGYEELNYAPYEGFQVHQMCDWYNGDIYCSGGFDNGGFYSRKYVVANNSWEEISNSGITTSFYAFAGCLVRPGTDELWCFDLDKVLVYDIGDDSYTVHNVSLSVDNAQVFWKDDALYVVGGVDVNTNNPSNGVYAVDSLFNVVNVANLSIGVSNGAIARLESGDALFWNGYSGEAWDYSNKVYGLYFSSPMPITACTDIAAGGEYVLTGNVSTYNWRRDCVQIDAPGGNVTIDGKGYTFTADGNNSNLYSLYTFVVKNADNFVLKNMSIDAYQGGTASSALGLVIDAGAEVNNILVQDVSILTRDAYTCAVFDDPGSVVNDYMRFERVTGRMQNCPYGPYVYVFTRNLSMDHVALSADVAVNDFFMDDADYAEIRNSIFTMPEGAGSIFATYGGMGGGQDALLVNNTFNASTYFGTLGGSPVLYLNDSVSGNMWVYPNGTGFSQTCTDANDDAICDSSYDVDGSGFVDYLPRYAGLEEMGRPLFNGTPNVTSPTSNQVVRVSAVVSSVNMCPDNDCTITGDYGIYWGHSFLATGSVLTNVTYHGNVATSGCLYDENMTQLACGTNPLNMPLVVGRKYTFIETDTTVKYFQPGASPPQAPDYCPYQNGSVGMNGPGFYCTFTLPFVISMSNQLLVTLGSRDEYESISVGAQNVSTSIGVVDLSQATGYSRNAGHTYAQEFTAESETLKDVQYWFCVNACGDGYLQDVGLIEIRDGWTQTLTGTLVATRTDSADVRANPVRLLKGHNYTMIFYSMGYMKYATDNYFGVGSHSYDDYWGTWPTSNLAFKLTFQDYGTVASDSQETTFLVNVPAGDQKIYVGAGDISGNGTINWVSIPIRVSNLGSVQNLSAGKSVYWVTNESPVVSFGYSGEAYTTPVVSVSLKNGSTVVQTKTPENVQQVVQTYGPGNIGSSNYNAGQDFIARGDVLVNVTGQGGAWDLFEGVGTGGTKLVAAQPMSAILNVPLVYGNAYTLYFANGGSDWASYQFSSWTPNPYADGCGYNGGRRCDFDVPMVFTFKNSTQFTTTFTGLNTSYETATFEAIVNDTLFAEMSLSSEVVLDALTQPVVILPSTVQNGPFNVTWSSANNGIGSVAYVLEKTYDGGVNWSSVASELSASPYLFSPSIESSQVKFRVQANDSYVMTEYGVGPQFEILLSPELSGQACPVLTYPNAGDAPVVTEMPVNFTVYAPLGFSSPSEVVGIQYNGTNHIAGVVCSYNETDSQHRTYNCTVPVKYFYLPGLYALNVTYTDGVKSVSILSSSICEVGSVYSHSVSEMYVTFPGAGPGIVNAPSGQSLILKNLGNVPLNVSLNGTDLIGVQNPSYVLPASSFKAGEALNTSVNMSNGVAVPLSVLPVGEGSEKTFFMWASIPSSLLPQSYHSVNPWQWLVNP